MKSWFDKEPVSYQSLLLLMSREMNASLQHWSKRRQRPKLSMRRIESIDKLAGQFFDEMQFGFLLDPARQLLSIGYQSADGALDPSCYDLLASEARLASFIAIAKGDVAPKHWFKLGRGVTPIDRGSALISWSGSMFEYLMPELVMREPEGSLLHQTARLIVSRQIEYGAQLGVPWGISEFRVQFPRCRAYLSIFQFWRSWTWIETRT